VTYLSFSQSSDSNLKPIIIKENNKTTYYAFTEKQVKEIAKILAKSKIDEEKIDLLEYQIFIETEKNDKNNQIIDSLESVVKKFYIITSMHDNVDINNKKIIANQVTIIEGLDGKVVRKNKTIKILVGTNVLLLIIVVLILL
jgi:hypothetical protein